MENSGDPQKTSDAGRGGAAHRSRKGQRRVTVAGSSVKAHAR
jgi:hypothetical protein